jgi:hypothetical protein
MDKMPTVTSVSPSLAAPDPAAPPPEPDGEPDPQPVRARAMMAPPARTLEICLFITSLFLEVGSDFARTLTCPGVG